MFDARMERVPLETHVDVLGQQLVRHSVLVDDVIVEACAGDGGAEQEPKDAINPNNRQSAIFQ
jgi:hypothetical protein